MAKLLRIKVNGYAPDRATEDTAAMDKKRPAALHCSTAGL